MSWRCTWDTGPDSGGYVDLADGRHVVGRAGTVRCDDPDLAPHHLLLDVNRDGVRVTQLAGRAPVRVIDAGSADGRTDGGAGGRVVEGRAVGPCTLEIGGSIVRLTATPPPEAPATVLTDGTVVRGPRAVPTWEPAELPPPEPPRRDERGAGGLTPAILGVVGAGTIALVMHQPMFLLFGALGALVAVGSWAGQHVATRRERRRLDAAYTLAMATHAAALAADRSAFLDHLRRRVPTTAASITTATERRIGLWSRRGAHGDAFVVGLGTGSVPWREDQPPVEATVATDLAPGARLALLGPAAHAMARALVLQLAVSCGPADLRLVVVTRDADRWAWARPLPHLRLPDGDPAIVHEDALADALAQWTDDAAVLLVTDQADALHSRTGPLRRALHDGTSLLAVCPDREAPHLCTAALTTNLGPLARWVPDTSVTLLPEPVRIAGMGAPASTRLAAALGDLRDPEDAAGAVRLPTTVALFELLGLPAGDGMGAPIDPRDIARRWQDHGARPPRAPIGVAEDGTVDIDLVHDGPHGLLAGTTGAGKSELLRTLVAGLATQASPAHLQIVLVDYKGGATFDALATLPHVAGVITDLDEQLADRALRSLHAELRRREALLREHGVADLAGLPPAVVLPRLLVVVDEFAALVAEQPTFLHALVGVAQRGRSLGVHLLLATQRPQGVISDDIRANTNLRIALRLHDVQDAMDVVGDRRAASLPRRLPGRAVMRLGADEYVVFQTARVDDVESLVRAIRTAASDAPPVPPPWLPPLPTELGPADVPDGAIGWCDDPDRQRRIPLRWSASDGDLVIAGSPGSGVTSTLRTLAAQAASAGDHVHVLTADGDTAWRALEHHPHCVVVPLHERDRLLRLLHRLEHDDEPPDGPRSIVVVDGLDAVRRALDDADTVALYEALESVLLSPRHVVVVGAARPAALPAAVLARCAHRWILHLTDPHDAGLLGGGVPGAVPGRLVVAATGLHAQVVRPAVPLHLTSSRASTRALRRIETVPDVVAASGLPGGRIEHGDTWLPVGVDHATGDWRGIWVPDGEHLMVLGRARSGRSTALTRLAVAWRQAHPGGRVVAVLPRRSAFATSVADDVRRDTSGVADLATGGPLLLVCDDAEALDDDGCLGGLVAGRRPGVTVVAAARGDALRQRYGHWTTAVRHSRLGLVSAATGDTDGDLLGAMLPRRLPVRARPGTMWVVSHEGEHLVQVAVDAEDVRARVAQ